MAPGVSDSCYQKLSFAPRPGTWGLCLPMFTGEMCPGTRFILAGILVLVGGAVLPAPAVPASIRISAGLKPVQEHSSAVNVVSLSAQHAVWHPIMIHVACRRNHGPLLPGTGLRRRTARIMLCIVSLDRSRTPIALCGHSHNIRAFVFFMQCSASSDTYRHTRCP